jgi:hypothetical protein
MNKTTQHASHDSNVNIPYKKFSINYISNSFTDKSKNYHCEKGCMAKRIKQGYNEEPY